MRIAIVSPLEIRVPPIKYGGIELVVSLLTEALVERGHQVTLFASGDSLTRAQLRSVCSSFLRDSDKTDEEKHALEMLNIKTCIEKAKEFDVINIHLSADGPPLEALLYASLSPTPVLVTCHGPHRKLDEVSRRLFLSFDGWYNTISLSCKKLLPEKEKFAGVIYDTIDYTQYPFHEGERKGYLLFLASISEAKGSHLAIEVAQRLKRRLVLVGNVHRPYNAEYFEQKVEPHLDSNFIHYAGEIDHTEKIKLFSQADCLLAPIQYEEGFGLYLLEAMASG